MAKAKASIFFDMCDISVKEANAQLNADPEVKKAKLKVAKEAQAYWKSIAPVGDPKVDPASGQYKEGIIVVTKKNVLVMATSANAWFVEMGVNGIHESACRARTQAYIQAKYKNAPEGK